MPFLFKGMLAAENRLKVSGMPPSEYIGEYIFDSGGKQLEQYEGDFVRRENLSNTEKIENESHQPNDYLPSVEKSECPSPMIMAEKEESHSSTHNKAVSIRIQKEIDEVSPRCFCIDGTYKKKYLVSISELSEGTLFYSEENKMFFMKGLACDCFKQIESFQIEGCSILLPKSIDSIAKDSDLYYFRVVNNSGSLQLKISMKLVGGGSRTSKDKVNRMHSNSEQSRPPPENDQGTSSKQIHPDFQGLEKKHGDEIRYIRTEYEIKIKELEQIIKELKMGVESKAREIPLNQENPTKYVAEDHVLLEWANYHLAKIGLKAKDTQHDFIDGFFLIMLIDIILGEILSGYHSRLFANEPISNGELINENKRIIIGWALTHNITGIEPTKSEELKGVIEPILWFLIEKSVNPNVKFENIGRTRYEDAVKIYQEANAPFPFDGLGLEESGHIALIRTCILLDKMKLTQSRSKERIFKKWAPAPQRYETSKKLDPAIFDERVIRAFLSSTFRDMQRERDEFFKNGAPVVKKMAKSKGVELVFIDLRWGLTTEDSSGGWVVIRCLDSITQCQYFVCSLGARYGWVPDQSKTELNLQSRLEELIRIRPEATMKDIWVEWCTETNERFPFTNQLPGLSVTEYEIQYACLIENPACSRVFFYLRDEEHAVQHAVNEEERKLYQAESEEARKRQDNLKKKVTEKYGHVVYKGAIEYSNYVTLHLIFAIERDFGNQIIRDPEDQAQHQFKMHRLTGFGGRKELLKTVTEKVTSQLQSENSKITVLAAESGIGKSSLMAATIRDLEAMNISKLKIFYHFVGCTNLSNYVESISIRFWTLVTNFENFSGQKRSETEFEKEGLNGLFKMIHGGNSDDQYVFVIDAINQIHPSQGTPAPYLLTWLPKSTPKDVAVVVSTIHTHESCKTIAESGMEPIPVTRLTKSEIKEGAVSFLKLYDKTLSETQIELILDNTDTGHPLYLRIVLDEVRVFGVYEKLDAELGLLLETKGVIELYTLVINRWQNKFDKVMSLDGKSKKKVEYVAISMKALFVSRIGLSEVDLDDFMKDIIGPGFDLPEWKSFFFTLIESLFVRNGRYMYFHQLLLETTEKVYFENKDEKTKTHEQYGKWLFGKYSEELDVDEELAAEICYQLLQGQCFDLLVDYLRQKHVIVTMLSGRYRYEFFNCWRVINEKGVANYADVYKTLAKSLNEEGDMLVEFFLECFENSFLLSVLTVRIGKRLTEESKAPDYLILGRVYKNLQNWTESMKCYSKCLDITEMSEKNRLSIATIHEEMGFIYQQENKISEALDEYKKSLDLRVKQLGENDLQVAHSFDRFGDIFLTQKKTEQALVEYEKSMKIRQKKFGNEHPLVATSYQNYGHVYLAEKKYDRAIESYQKAKFILENSLGDKHASVATTIQFISKVYLENEGKQEALGLTHQSLAIYLSSLGENHPNVVGCYEMIGDISHDLKQYKDALAAYSKTLDIRKRTLNEKHLDYATSLENVGRTNFELQSFSQAIDCFQKAATIRKGTKTVMILKDTQQIESIIRLVKEKKEHGSVIQLYKTAAIRHGEMFSFENWDCWVACEAVHTYCKELKQHNEAIEFWSEMKNIFTIKLGWIHPRTLNSCEYLSYHSREVGIDKEPIEFSRVKDFITEITESVEFDNEWNREQISSCLFQIVDMSKVDETKSKHASDAITLLNLMNTSIGKVNLSNTRIPHANLSNSIVDGANFTGTNLDGADFTNSSLGDCVFDESNMNGVKFGIPHDKLEGHTKYVSTICNIQGPNGESWLASGSSDKTIRIWEIATGNQIKILEGHTHSVNSILSAEGPNGENWLISGSSDKTIRIWDISSGNQLKILEGHTDYVNSICKIQGPNGETLIISGSSDISIRIWDIASGNQIKILEGHTDCIFSVGIIQGFDGKPWLASGSFKEIRVWDTDTGNQIKLLEGHAHIIGSVCSIQGPNEEKWLASASDDKTIIIWDITTGNQIKVLEGHSGYVHSVCSIQGPNGENWLASSSSDKTIRIWNVATGNQIKILKGHTGAVWNVCSIREPYGESWLASGSEDKTIRIWDIVTGNQMHNTQVSKVVSTAGKTIASKESRDGTIAGSKKPTDSIKSTGKNTTADGKTIQNTASRKLFGGNIQLRNVKGLSMFNKRLLLSIGAASFDEDFVKYCNEGKYTKFQAHMVADCYENGWGVEVNADMATDWRKKAA